MYTLHDCITFTFLVLLATYERIKIINNLSTVQVAKKRNSAPGKCGQYKMLKGEIYPLEAKVTRLNKIFVNNQEQWVETFKEVQEQRHLFQINTGKTGIIKRIDI